MGSGGRDSTAGGDPLLPSTESGRAEGATEDADQVGPKVTSMHDGDDRSIGLPQPAVTDRFLVLGYPIPFIDRRVLILVAGLAVALVLAAGWWLCLLYTSPSP